METHSIDDREILVTIGHADLPGGFQVSHTRPPLQTQVEHGRWLSYGLRVTEIARHQAVDVFSEGHTQIAGALPSRSARHGRMLPLTHL